VKKPDMLPGDGDELRIVEMRITGYAVQDVEDDYIYDLRFNTRQEAEEYIARLKGKVN
jgi:hypothetical protein